MSLVPLPGSLGFRSSNARSGFWEEGTFLTFSPFPWEVTARSGRQISLEKPECTSSHHSSSLFNSNRHNENRARLRETMQSNLSQGNEPSSLTSKDPVRRQRDITRRAWSVATDSPGVKFRLVTLRESLSHHGKPLHPRMQSVGDSRLEELPANCVKHSDHTVPLCVCTCYSLDVTSLGPMWPTIQAQVCLRPEMLKSPGPEYIISGLNVILGHCLYQRPINNGISL